MNEIIDVLALDDSAKSRRLKWLNSRQRWMRCVLYPESQSDAIEYIKNCFPCLMILHDRDEGQKPHMHIIIHLENGRKPVTVAKKLGIANGYLLPVDDARAAEDYLTHDTPKAREEGKYRYDKSAVEYYNDYVYASDDGLVDSTVMAHEMFAIMATATSYYGFVQVCLERGYYNELKRSSSIWSALWNERRRELGIR